MDTIYLTASIVLLVVSTSCSSASTPKPQAKSEAKPAANPEAKPEAKAAAAPAAKPAAKPADQAPTLADFKANSLEGEAAPLDKWRGKVVLVVNVASQCGFTPQYKGLEALHQELESRGFAVLGFPCNEFGGQEPGDAKEIRTFCTDHFQVTFPMFEKVQVKPGDGLSPIYAWLEGATGQVPSWNFCKYLVGRDGKPIQFFPSKTTPDAPDLRAAIETALAAK
jgi:glutathione peroxidase